MFERRLYYHIDWALLAAVLALCALGVVMIFSTTADPTRGASHPYITQNYAIVLGDDELGSAYGGVGSLPTSFILDRSGRVVAIQTGLTEKGHYEAVIRSALGR